MDLTFKNIGSIIEYQGKQYMLYNIVWGKYNLREIDIDNVVIKNNVNMDEIKVIKLNNICDEYVKLINDIYLTMSKVEHRNNLTKGRMLSEYYDTIQVICRVLTNDAIMNILTNGTGQIEESIVCLKCNVKSSSIEWNEATINKYGKNITDIEEAYQSKGNYMFICPNCKAECGSEFDIRKDEYRYDKV